MSYFRRTKANKSQHPFPGIPTYNVYFEKARLVDSARDLALCVFLKERVESSYRRDTSVTKPACRFPETLLLLKKTNDETASEKFYSVQSFLGATRFENTAVSSSVEHDTTLYFGTAPTVIDFTKRVFLVMQNA